MSLSNHRADFPILKRKIHNKDLIFFDHAASTFKPQIVIDRINQHNSFETANIHRGIYTLSDEGTHLFEQTRQKVKEFINAQKVHEIIFTSGTTDSINLLASSFCSEMMSKGDEILLSQMEHHSNIVPWQMIAKQYDLVINVVNVLDSGELDIEDFKSKLNSKTKIVALTHSSNTLGTTNPIKELIKLSHNNGSFFFLDAAQASGHEKLNVKELDVDFLAFSAHKMYGPTGVGILYGKEELLEKLPPYRGGGAMIEEVSFDGTTFNDLPHKFEAGTPHISGVISFKTAMDYLDSIGLEKIKEYERELLLYATKKLSEIDKLKIIGRAEEKAPVLSFVIEGAHHHDIGTLLDQQGIAIRTGHHCTQPLMKRFGITGTSRASFSFINTKQEIDYFSQALIKCQELL